MEIIFYHTLAKVNTNQASESQNWQGGITAKDKWASDDSRVKKKRLQVLRFWQSELERAPEK